MRSRCVLQSFSTHQIQCGQRLHAFMLCNSRCALLHAGANAFVQPAALPQSTASAAVHSRTVPSMVATPERVVVQSTAPFDPVGGSNAPLKVNNQGNVWVPQRARPRRNRKSEAMRSMVRETIVTPANFIYPLFIHEEVRLLRNSDSTYYSVHLLVRALRASTIRASIWGNRH
jgi:Delta-aminolevulinic acid dehydratase